MKRPRSYEEDLDEDWARRDLDSDRRRFYLKVQSSRKGLSSSSSYEDDREPSRAPWRRFEHEMDRFDRQKSFDRHRDPMQVSSSSRGDRLHRSESFSGGLLRREFPEGFRSERERSRREGWRRSSSGKESADEEMRSPAGLVDSDSVRRRNHHVMPEDGRGRVRSRDSSTGEHQSRRLEAAKEEKVTKGESCNSSEMEEGELEPDPEPEPTADDPMEPPVGLELENCKDKETELNNCSNVEESSSRKEEIFLVENKSEFDNVKEEGRLPETAVDPVDGNDEVADQQSHPVKGLDDKRREREGGAEDANDGADEGNLGGDKKEILEDESLCLPSRGLEPEGQGEEQVVEEDKVVAISTSPPAPLAVKLDKKHGEGQEVVADVEAGGKKEETDTDLKVEQDGSCIDLEAEPEGTICLFSLSEEVVVDNNRDEVTLKLMTDKPLVNHKDKGKSIAISLSNKADSVGDEDATDGPSSRRGFELVFPSDVIQSYNANCGGIVVGKQKVGKLKFEPLDLSLGLPGISSDHTSKHLNPNPGSPSRARSIQSLPSSFRTSSDGFTTSISFSGSQPFAHNPSCSLTHNSTENYEQSVGSHPIFQGVDQVSDGTMWQAQTSNEPKRKGGGAGSLFQRILMNGNPPHNSLQALNGHHHSKPNGLSRQSSLPRHLSPTNSHSSRDTRSEHSQDKRLLTRERSSSSLLRSEQWEGEQLVLSGVSLERIVSKIVSEPLQVVGRILKEMTEHSIAYLKETICEMVINADKRGQIHALQEVLQRRSDLTMETLPKCPRTLLEILVALKTGLPDFLQRTHNNVPSNDLVEIFLNLKCQNLACRSILPVDDCDCKVCILKNGFCSACMCLVCSKFDMASNTCSWVGCDVCLHWCHTDCGLKDSHIRNGPSSSGTQGVTEMQFHCIACDHPSEMLGFVTEVFKTCAKDWKAETLAMELQYVKRIFSASNDVKGKKLCGVADQMLRKIEDKVDLSEIINYIMAFLLECKSNINSSSSIFPPKEPSRNNAEGSNAIACPGKEATWLPSVSSGKVSPRETTGVLSSRDADRVVRQTRDAELQMNLEKKPVVVDELESVVRFKQAEAKMYKERADSAKREAEGLKRIAGAKNVKIDEDYASRIAKLRLSEAEDRRRQKLEELQVIERAHREYFNMKMRMEAGIKDLLLKMEATKRNFNS